MRRPAIVLNYVNRAVGLHRAAEDLVTLDRDLYAPAIGLLSVHGSIALADALLSSVLATISKSDDHADAARSLRDWCSSTRLQESGIKHFEWLLGHKSRFSYGDDRVEIDELIGAKVKMDQFFAWAFRTFPDVAQLREIKEDA